MSLRKALKKCKVKYPMVAVVWHDSAHLHEGGWGDRKDKSDFGLTTCVSVGFLREYTRKRFVIAEGMTDTQMLGVLVIPAEAVCDVYLLEPK